LSKCSRIFEALENNQKLSIEEIAKETNLPEAAIVYVIEKSHPEKFKQTGSKNSNSKKYSLR